MVDRVMLSATALKISKPGVDVKTAPPYSLLFDSEASAMNKYVSGTVNIPTGSGDYFINYGTTFTTFPLVLMRCRLEVSNAWTGTNRFNVYGTGTGLLEVNWTQDFNEGYQENYVLAVARKNRIQVQRAIIYSATIDYIILNYLF